MCIVDWCCQKGGETRQFSADYEGGFVIFGGEWENIPNWKTKEEPTEEDVLSHVRKYIKEVFDYYDIPQPN